MLPPRLHWRSQGNGSRTGVSGLHALLDICAMRGRKHQSMKPMPSRATHLHALNLVLTVRVPGAGDAKSTA
eukprot:5859523-Amphidinium_carterae.1